VVSVHSWSDGAGRLTRVMLEAAAEVVAMRKGEGQVFDQSEWMTGVFEGGMIGAVSGWKKDLVVGSIKDHTVTICTFVSNQIII
jgi:hypothetical protein